VVFELFVVLIWVAGGVSARGGAAGRRPGKEWVGSSPTNAGFGV